MSEYLLELERIKQEVSKIQTGSDIDPGWKDRILNSLNELTTPSTLNTVSLTAEEILELIRDCTTEHRLFKVIAKQKFSYSVFTKLAEKFPGFCTVKNEADFMAKAFGK